MANPRSNPYFVFTDSSIEPFNPGGLLTWAFIVKWCNKIIHQDTKIIGWGNGMTNNLGEYTAVLAAMQWLLSLPESERYTTIVNSDSQLVVKQCSGAWACHEETLASILSLIQRSKVAYGKAITFRWISRGKNTEADTLSRSLYKGKEQALALLKARRLDILFDGDDLPW
jgi:ribonuclease HI